MADLDDAENAVLDALVASAQGAEKAGGSRTSYAKATRDLAEAWAWLQRPDQPHGGSTTVQG